MEAYIWLAALVVFLVLEAVTVDLVSVWFAAGSLIALILAIFHVPLWAQILAFVAVSVVLLAALRPLVRKYVTPRITRTNVDSIIGAEGYVTQPIDNLSAAGQVKLRGMEWTARSTAGDPIPAGARIRVDRVEGVKVFVTPVTETVNV